MKQAMNWDEGSYKLSRAYDGLCRKPKIGSDSILKTKPSKNLTSIQTVFRQKLRAVCNSD